MAADKLLFAINRNADIDLFPKVQGHTYLYLNSAHTSGWAGIISTKATKKNPRGIAVDFTYVS